jgi:hypothetical protein
MKSPAPPEEVLASWRLLAREMLAPEPGEVVLPWICIDDENARFLERADLGQGLRLEQIDLDGLERIGLGGFVLLLLGSAEIGVEATRLIRAVRSREIGVHPLVLLGDGYFKIPEGELFHYTQPLALLREHSGRNPVVAFRCPRDMAPLSGRVRQYFQALGALAVLVRARSLVDGFRHFAADLARVEDVPAGGSGRGMRNAFLTLLQGRLAAVREALATCMDPAPDAEAAILGLIEGLQRDNQQEAFAERYPTLGSSRLAAEFVGTEVLDASRLVDAFLSDCRSRGGLLADLGEDLRDVASADSLSTTVSFVGTFSSGKTTLLNQLLWGAPRLRTSQGHNTAILTEILFDSAVPPRLELEWKADVRLDLLFPSNDFDVAVESPYAGTVVEVNVHPIYSVVWIQDSRGRRRDVPLGPRNPIVAEGQAVKSGQVLSSGLPPSHRRSIRWYSGFGRRDLAAIERLIAQGGFEKAQVEVAYTNGQVELRSPRDVFPRLRRAVAEKYNSSLEGEAVKEALGSVLSVTFTARLSPRRQLPGGFPLDEDGWELFQGGKDRPPLAEDPVCYLFLDKARIHLQHDFLRFASLVDTPGLGSVTDRHDEITESYLRGRSGLIVLFIKMDHQWERREMWRLVHLIRSLPEERTRDNVLVFCNRWSKMPQGRIEPAMLKLRRLLGTRFPDIFVFDLQHLLETGQTPPRVTGFGTFDEMRDLLKRKVHERGAGRGLREVQEKVDGVLRRRISNLEGRRASQQASEEKRSQRRRQLQEVLDSLSDGKDSASMKHLNEAVHAYKPIVALLDNKASWRDNREALIDAANMINRAVADRPFDGLLVPVGTVQQALRRLSLRLATPELPDPPAGDIPVVALGNKIDSIIRDWPLMTFSFGSYRGRRRDEMKSWFADHADTLMKRLEKHRKKCEALVQDFYQSARKLLKDQIASLAQDGGTDKNPDEELAFLQNEVRPHWQKISRAIDRALQGG